MKTITIKIATNSQLSTTESIKQTNKQANYTNNQNSKKKKELKKNKTQG